ncbi:MAG: hypothetical protein ACXV3D_00400 [Halobacteriota archaeon]
MKNDTFGEWQRALFGQTGAHRRVDSARSIDRGAGSLTSGDAKQCTPHDPVSGRYVGRSMAWGSARHELELRIDIDARDPNSIATNCVSGDVYEVQEPHPGQPAPRTYSYSWIVDEPHVEWSPCSVVVTGEVRRWKGQHPSGKTDLKLTVRWSSRRIEDAQAVFIVDAETRTRYTCKKTSDCFRDLKLEVGVCKSVNKAPLQPSYNTRWHSVRPVDTPERLLSIERAYWEAGVAVTINQESSEVDDSTAQYHTWSDAELHDAMERYFSAYGGPWPKWEMWGLLAGNYDEDGVAGIMFDVAAQYGGAGQAPERQGFAVFRNHEWFQDLVGGVPANDAQAAAMRAFLYSFVHEAGHAFNLLHSWDKERPDALSWMNYDWKFDQRNGTDSFYRNFLFEFDDPELRHIRHGDLLSVMMGGDPWASGGHLEARTEAWAQDNGNAPVELILRSKGYFDLMEPVIVELSVRNRSALPVDLNTLLKPEFGSTAIFIQCPDGKTVQYDPVSCKMAAADVKTLAPETEDGEGHDRHNDTMFISYGRGGFYFAQPGEYRVRAVYRGRASGGILIPSNIARIRIGQLPPRVNQQAAYEYFTYQAGMSLYLHGSRSPTLTEGMQTLETLARDHSDTLLGAKIAGRIAPNIARPFFRIDKNNALTQAHPGDPEEALKLTEPAVTVFRKLKGDEAKATNITYHKLVRTRTALLEDLGQTGQAKQEAAELLRDLGKRGVKKAVLNDIKRYKESL